MLNKLFSKTKQRSWIWILTALAATRVFVFAAAFPLFNNVDEQAHVDLVLRYSHGEPARALPPIANETAYYFSLYGSPEYFSDPGRGEFPEPMWRQPEAKVADRFAAVR